MPFVEMQPRHVAKLRDHKAATPEAANARVKAMRQLFSWSTDPEYALAETNPAKEVKYLKPANPDGHRTWTEAELAQYDRHYALGSKAKLFIDLATYTGARISDLARFSPAMVRDGVLHWTEYKGRKHTVKRHATRILPPLEASIAAYLASHPRPAADRNVIDLALPYVLTEHGKAHSIKGLGQWFARQVRLAGLGKGLSAHGLRKAAAVRCANAGASEGELEAMFGWETAKQAALYTRMRDRALQEARAIDTILRPGDVAGDRRV
jgi:integrase